MAGEGAGAFAWLSANHDSIVAVASAVTALAGVAITFIALAWTRRQARLQAMQELMQALQTYQLASLQDPALMEFMAGVQKAEDPEALRKSYFFFSVLNLHFTAHEARRSGLAPKDFMTGTLAKFCRSFSHEREFLRAHVLPEYPRAMSVAIEREWRLLDKEGGVER